MPPDGASYRQVTTNHLIKSEDLNHHLTLYAGRCVEWCVEMAYVTAQRCFDKSRPLVFMSIRSLSMRSPARLGDILQLTGTVDYTGDSTIGVRVDARLAQPAGEGRAVATGTFLFCTVDAEGKAVSHGLPAPANASDASHRRWKKHEDAAEPASEQSSAGSR